MYDLLLSPPVASVTLLLLVIGLYRLGGALGAKGGSTPGKHLPYTGGELPGPMPRDLGYHAFFRLALLFAVLHVAALVVSTLPHDARSHRLAVIYLVGIAVSVYALSGKEP